MAVHAVPERRSKAPVSPAKAGGPQISKPLRVGETRLYRWVRHALVAEFEAAGWRRTHVQLVSHHHYWSALMERGEDA